EALELLHDDAARWRHVAGVAPGHFERRAAHQLCTLEQREVEVVELERDLVGLLLGVLVGEGDDAPSEVERLAAWCAFVVEQRDPHAGPAAVDDGHASNLRRCSLRMTSVSTRRLGTTRRLPTSSSRVGSTMGSGWKSASTHQKPQARGSGAKYRPARPSSVSPCATTWTRVSVCSLKRYGSRSLRKRRPRSSGTPSAKECREPVRGAMPRQSRAPQSLGDYRSASRSSSLVTRVSRSSSNVTLAA